MIDTSKIPGMIEPVEQQMLFDLARSGVVGDGAVAVEFGCFFGRSTACLVNGVEARGASAGQGPLVYAYDSFACADADGFAQPVWAFSRNAGVDGLVRREAGRIDFYPVYRHYLGAAEESGVLRTLQTELRDARYDGPPIGLMHIDAPKFYQEFKYILARFFPRLTVGAAVVFQDYFYHWSATLIAAVQLLAEAGVVRFETSRASALVARVLRTPTADELLELDIAMAQASTPELIDRAVAMAGALELDRREMFLPRLELAKLQYLFEAGDFVAAEAIFSRMVQGSGAINRSVFIDFLELMRHGFRLRQLYDRDH